MSPTIAPRTVLGRLVDWSLKTPTRSLALGMIAIAMLSAVAIAATLFGTLYGIRGAPAYVVPTLTAAAVAFPVVGWLAVLLDRLRSTNAALTASILQRKEAEARAGRNPSSWP